MRIRNKVRTLTKLINAKLFNNNFPLAVRWQLTNRCILRCKYCNVWNTPSRELSLEQIIHILNQLAFLGTETISFSGGEPLLRDDIGEILKQTKARNISTEMNSTGAYISKNVHKLKDLDFLKISLDGPEEIHDLLRGKGSYKMVMDAANEAKIAKIKFIFSTTLTKFNLQSIDFLIDIARKYDTFIAFQPLKRLYRGVEDIKDLSPNPEDYKKAIYKLIVLSKKSRSFMRNSMMGLQHIYDWPNYKKIKCWAGKIFCIIEPDGSVLPCDRISYKSKLPNCLDSGFEIAFFSLPDVYCEGCGFCGPLELNYLMAMKFQVLKSIRNIL